MTRSRLASCCMMATHCCTRSLRLTLTKLSSSLPASIFDRSSRSLSSEMRCPPEVVDVLEVLPVAVVAERPEALLHHHLGKADDGIERGADLVADLGEEFGLCRGGFFRLLAGVDQFFLGALPGGDVAQHRAEFLAVLDAAHGHVKRHQPALAHAADQLAALVEQRRFVARETVEIVERGAAAFRREQLAERRARRSPARRSRTAPARCGWPRARGRRGREPARRRSRCREWP